MFTYIQPGLERAGAAILALKVLKHDHTSWSVVIVLLPPTSDLSVPFILAAGFLNCSFTDLSKIQQRFMPDTAGTLGSHFHDPHSDWLLHILPLNTHSTWSIFICIELILFPQTNFLYTWPSIQTGELWNTRLLGESVCVAVLQDWIGISQAFTSIEVHCYPQRHLKTQT